MVESLWGDDFTVDNEAKTKKILNKIKKPKEVKVVSTDKLLKSKAVSIEDKMEAIKADVNKILGHYQEDTLCIKDIDTFKAYIDAAIENGVIAIDTETNNSLNTFDCKIMGLCLYTPGKKNAYVPVNHVNRETNEKLSWQITEAQIKEQLQRLVDAQVFQIYHNATFDIEVIMTTCGIRLHADWDTLVGAQLLNENELKGLKTQYQIHINPEQEKYNIEHLFKGLPYEIFDPDLFALYAATDSFITYKLYEYQKEELRKPENKEVYELFQKIEIPVIEAIVDMEMNGVEIDLEYAQKMSTIYHAKSDEVQSRIDAELLELKPIIDQWRTSPEANAHPAAKNKSGVGKSKAEQLMDPPDLGSPTQMAVLLYDVLKVPQVSKKSPRGTGADILEELAPKYKICSLLLEKRDVDILINTFIDKIPEFIQKDGRVHAKFNQCGTQTGRFSSSSPNLQQIPSHDKAIRMMFKASDGCSIIGGDYSGQEPRSLCAFSKDKAMQDAYAHKKDLYAVIAAACFHNKYEDNLEFHPVTHELQPDGKKRRSKAKTVFLGVSYGMGPKTLADRMGLPMNEAKQIIADFYKGFPGVDKFTKESQEMARKYGYVTDLFGRRRHLPDAQLPEFEFKISGGSDFSFNPLLGAKKHEDNKGKALIAEYSEKLARTKWKADRDAIIAEAKAKGLEIKSNSGYISKAERQTLNARIQGSAASMTKLAMTMIHDDEELKKLGFKLLVSVHDEVFGEAPTENAEAAGKRLCEVMVAAANVKCSFTNWSVDPYMVKRWYADECAGEILNDYNKACAKMTKEEAYAKIKSSYSMIQDKYLEMMCNDEYDPNTYQDI